MEYDVKEILDSQVRNNKIEYLVWWDGYDIEDSTWEPLDHLENAEEKINQFHERYPLRRGREGYIASQKLAYLEVGG